MCTIFELLTNVTSPSKSLIMVQYIYNLTEIFEDKSKDFPNFIKKQNRAKSYSFKFVLINYSPSSNINLVTFV